MSPDLRERPKEPFTDSVEAYADQMTKFLDGLIAHVKKGTTESTTQKSGTGGLWSSFQRARKTAPVLRSLEYLREGIAPVLSTHVQLKEPISCSWKKFRLLLSIEPAALDVEELPARKEAPRRKRVDCELRDRCCPRA